MTDLRNAGLARGLQPVGAGGEHAADQLVGQLGRRQVEHPGDLPPCTSASIDWPPTPVA